MPSSTKWRRFAGWERQWLLQALVMSGCKLHDKHGTPHMYKAVDEALAWGLDNPHADLLDVEESALEKLIPDKAARALFGAVDETTFRNAVENA